MADGFASGFEVDSAVRSIEAADANPSAITQASSITLTNSISMHTEPPGHTFSDVKNR